MCKGSFSTKGKAAGALTLYLPVADVCSYTKQKKKLTRNSYFSSCLNDDSCSVPQEGYGMRASSTSLAKGEQEIKDVVSYNCFPCKRANFTCKRLIILTTKPYPCIFQSYNKQQDALGGQSVLLILSDLGLELVFQNSFTFSKK